jgi:hypothetical protein
MFVFISIHNGESENPPSILGDVILFSHLALNMYRLILAFGYQSSGKATLMYLNSVLNWSTYWLFVSFTPILWIGDALVVRLAIS